MKNSKSGKLNFFKFLNFGNSNLFRISILVFSILALSSLVNAMSGPAPKKEEPKYKLQILKMEFVPAITAEVKTKVPLKAKVPVKLPQKPLNK